MQKTITANLISFDNLNKKLVWFLLAWFLLLIFSYIYLVNDSMVFVLARKQAEEAIARTETAVTVLVSDYMTKTNNINLAKAHDLGFVEAGNRASFVVRSTESALTLSLGNNEI